MRKTGMLSEGRDWYPIFLLVVWVAFVGVCVVRGAASCRDSSRADDCRTAGGSWVEGRCLDIRELKVGER